jgi:hypothetical protein
VGGYHHYSLDSVIANNVISNVTHGLGVHCVTTLHRKVFSRSSPATP